MDLSKENKCSIEDLRRRFDTDVERFSNLETGQKSAVDAPLMLELVARAAVSCTLEIRHILDIGCGGGNYAVKLLTHVPQAHCDLVDLSSAMLTRAFERVSRATTGTVTVHQGDFRTVDLPENYFDVITAGSVFHHLRDDDDWEDSFRKLYRITAPGGSVWIADLVAHENPEIQSMMFGRYASYLELTGGREFRDSIVKMIDTDDTPRPVTWQTELLRKVGFSQVDILHKNSCFAAFGAVKH